MDWMKLTVHINENASEIISEILLNAGAQGTETGGGSLPDVSGYDYVDPDDWKQEGCTVSAYFACDAEMPSKIAQVKNALQELKQIDIGIDPGTLDVDTATVNEEDWENAWKKYFKPQRVSNYVVVKPTWEDYSPASDEIIVEIDPGMAFGTGAHESTRMCISMLEEYMENGATVLDIGCGSGILSVAAAKLGASNVLALDLDTVAVEVAEKNVQLNHEEDKIKVMRSDITAEVPKGARYNVVVANIIADVIIRMNSTIMQYLNKPGIYICSGIIAERLEDVLASLSENNFLIIKVAKMGEWRAVACKYKR